MRYYTCQCDSCLSAQLAAPPCKVSKKGKRSWQAFRMGMVKVAITIKCECSLLCVDHVLTNVCETLHKQFLFAWKSHQEAFLSPTNWGPGEWERYPRSQSVHLSLVFFFPQGGLSHQGCEAAQVFSFPSPMVHRMDSQTFSENTRSGLMERKLHFVVREGCPFSLLIVSPWDTHAINKLTESMAPQLSFSWILEKLWLFCNNCCCGINYL